MQKGMEKKCAMGFKGDLLCGTCLYKRLTDIYYECDWRCGTMRVKIKDDLLKNRSVDSYVR